MPTSALAALLQIPGLIHHHHRVRAAQPPGRVLPHVITDTISVPAGPRQQVLHPARAGIPGLLGDGPAGSSQTMMINRWPSLIQPRTADHDLLQQY